MFFLFTQMKYIEIKDAQMKSFVLRDSLLVQRRRRGPFVFLKEKKKGRTEISNRKQSLPNSFKRKKKISHKNDRKRTGKE